jgi:hypothetical protein
VEQVPDQPGPGIQEFVVGGYTPGNPLDALIVGFYTGSPTPAVKRISVASIAGAFYVLF